MYSAFPNAWLADCVVIHLVQYIHSTCIFGTLNVQIPHVFKMSICVHLVWFNVGWRLPLVVLFLKVVQSTGCYDNQMIWSFTINYIVFAYHTHRHTLSPCIFVVQSGQISKSHRPECMICEYQVTAMTSFLIETTLIGSWFYGLDGAHSLF